MSYFKIVLDRRTARKNGKFDLTVRYNKGNDIMYLKVAEMDEFQFKHVFEKKSMDRNSIDFRQQCNDYVSKCEKIYSEMKSFNKKDFRDIFFNRKPMIGEGRSESDSLSLKVMFDEYVKSSRLKIKTAEHYRTTINVFETYQSNLSINDITPDFLENFTRARMTGNKSSRATIDSYERNLRSVINYYLNVKKSLPKEYEYPFGKGRYIVRG